MSIQTRTVDYFHDDTTLEGLLAWDTSDQAPRPGVLVFHAYGGRNEFECERARILARLGYSAFAVDLYGKGVRSDDPAESERLMQPFLTDRSMLNARMQTAIDVFREQAEVDESTIAGIGYCFGGLCVLDLARTGADLRGVVSVHGLFDPPAGVAPRPTKTKVLVLHGWDDPMVLPEAVLKLSRELSDLQVDWQLHAYGNTMHAFTNPAANAPENGVLYSADADRRSWQSTVAFLAELFN
jgi:dienelactone hydrolase